MCAPSIQNFLNSSWTYPVAGGSAAATTLNFAKWVSYQSFLSPYCGVVPVSLIVTQWGIETGWGSTFGVYNNPGNQGDWCGYSSACGRQPNGLAAFCDLNDGVKSFAGLLIKGYPHVAEAWSRCGQPGCCVIAEAARALGIGYYDFRAVADGFCGPYTTISSGSPRIWDAGLYDDGNGPGSSIYDTINANPDCLGNLNFVQTTDPGVAGFPGTYCSDVC